LKYQPGQKYEEHWDWFEEEERKKMDIDDTNRIATILVYLSGELGLADVHVLIAKLHV
jgi:hypothetical protein